MTFQKKFYSVTLGVFMVGGILFPNIAQADDTTTTKSSAQKPFPSQPQPGMTPMPLMSGNFGNDNVQGQVGPDGRFNLGLDEQGTDNSFNIMYAWPSSPWSSFTTVKVDGADEVYGDYPDGTFLETPRNIDSTSNESIWKTGDVSVKQSLQAAQNPATGIPDAIKISYTITNTGTTDHSVGLRMMLDTMVNNNDGAPFRIPELTGMQSVTTETDFYGSQVPDFWQAFQSFDNPDISAQYTMRGSNATPPDRFTIARWPGIQETTWDYAISPDSSVQNDSAVGMWWNPVTISPGQTRTITTYYGRPGVGGSQTLVLSGRQRLAYDEWSAGPSNLIAYLNNSSQSQMTNVSLKVVPQDSGIQVIDNDPVHTVGDVSAGMAAQTTWRLQPTSAGTHTVTVEAYQDGSTTPFATTDYQVEALPPVVPTNITLSGAGDHGTTSDGTPVAGRVSPLTINATFNNPTATSVDLVATGTDISGNPRTYTHTMSTTDGVNWTHTFIPWTDGGLWGSPIQVQIIPHYSDGTTGAPQTFPIVLIDPSGVVYNAAQGTNWTLPGATVELQYFDPTLNTWVDMSDDAYPGRMTPISNPEITGADGNYAWDVAAGRYRVIVSRPGFATATSDPVDIPPPITNLNIALTPTDSVAPTVSVTGVQDSNSYTQPVNVNIDAADDASGVRTLSYQIDGGQSVNVNGTHATVNVQALGQHTIVVNAVDQAGNPMTKTIAFSIANPSTGTTKDQLVQALSAAQTANADALSKTNAVLSGLTTASSADSITGVNNAKASNLVAKNAVSQLITLLANYSDPKLSSSQLTLIRMQANAALQQNTLMDSNLATASTQLASGASLTNVQSSLNAAASASQKSSAYLKYVSGYLLM